MRGGSEIDRGSDASVTWGAKAGGHLGLPGAGRADARSDVERFAVSRGEVRRVVSGDSSYRSGHSLI